MIRDDRPVLLGEGADKKILAAIERLRCGFDEIQERWNNRYVFNPVTLLKDYINGRFELLAYENRRVGAYDCNLVARISFAATIAHNVAAGSQMNVVDRRNPHGGDDELVFVIVVQVTDGAESATLPLRVGLQLVPNEHCSVRHGLLYRDVGTHGFKVFPVATKGHREPTFALGRAEGFDAGCGPVIEAGPKVMNDISNTKREVLRDWFQGNISHLKLVRFFAGRGNSNLVQIAGKVGAFGDERIKVALGPFNL